MAAYPASGVLTDSPGATRCDWCLCGRLTEYGESQSIALSEFPFRVGRRSGLALTLLRPTVSGLHAEFYWRDARLFVRDLDSTNGTFVNGIRLFGEREVLVGDLVQFADVAFRIVHTATERPSQTLCENHGDRALALVQFGQLIDQQAVEPYFQPIVEIAGNDVVAFEVLARSRLVGLETPDLMFAAAGQLGQVARLSQVIRQVSLKVAGVFPEPPHLFLNTHPVEVTTREFLASCADLRRLEPLQRITIEIHEAAVTRIAEMATLCRALEDLQITVAFDDFGAGQARIAELAEVRPQYVKFDRSLVRQIDQADASRRRVIAGLIDTLRAVEILPIAEGVETPEEARVCTELGFALAQGYLFGRPMPATHYSRPT
jgi:EAL domain-containing protein (putative c-di-GMP-specific phosphodiesterase class I)